MVLVNYFMNFADFHSVESATVVKSNGIKPKLGDIFHLVQYGHAWVQQHLTHKRRIDMSQFLIQLAFIIIT